MSEPISNNAGGEETVTDPAVSNKTKRKREAQELEAVYFQREDRRPGGVRRQAQTETEGSIHEVPKRDRELCIDKFQKCERYVKNFRK